MLTLPKGDHSDLICHIARDHISR